MTIRETVAMEIINCNQLPPDKNHLDLLKYTLYNKSAELENLLKSKKGDININCNYGRPFEKTLVEIACTEYAFKIEPECVLILLKHGADKELALTSAALGGNPKLLKTILEYFNTVKYSIKYSSVILKTIKNMNKEVAENLYAGCVQLLINHGVDINFKPKSSSIGPNAIFLAAQNNYALIVNVILSSSLDTVDLDCYKDAKLGTARDIILMNKMYKNTLPPPKGCNRNKIFLLQKYIDAHDEFTFITEYTTMKNANKMDAEYEKELLIYAIQKGAITIVRYLICSGLNINGYDIKTSFPLFVACKKGYYKIAKILIDYSNSTYISAALVMMLQTVYFHQFCMDEMEINHEKCFDLLLNSEELDINYKLGNSKPGLYYAIKNQPNALVLKMLDRGASLAQLDLNDTSWCVFLTPDVLEKHLDKCVKIDSVKEITNGINLLIDFSTLLPVENKTIETRNEDSENTKFLESSKNFSNQKNSSKIIESKVLEYMSDKSEFYSVLQHPLIHIYLYLKWQKFRLFFYSNLIFHLLYSVSLISYLVLPYFDYKNTTILLVLFYFIIIALCLLSARELIQLYTTRWDYLKNYENILDVLLLSLTIILLTIEKENSAWFKQISAFVIIFTTMESISILGRHIDFLFSTITMLSSVTLTLLKFILPFFILIIAFSFSFFILFQKEKKENGERSTSEEKNHFFSNPGLSLFKTSLMLTGEFDAGEIDFSSYPITSPLLFILFVFLMNIVLFGVFTALAINDIQQVKEIQSQIMRIKQIVYMDKMLKCTRFNFLTSRIIEMDLEHSRLFMKNERNDLKIHKRVVDALKKLIYEKNELPKPFGKECPALRHSTIKKRRVKRFLRTSNVDEYEFV